MGTLEYDDNDGEELESADDDLLEEQEGKSYGEDEGEREDALDEQ